MKSGRSSDNFVGISENRGFWWGGRMGSKPLLAYFYFYYHFKLFHAKGFACDLNASVRGRVSSSRTRFWTQSTVKSAVSLLSDPLVISNSEFSLLYLHTVPGWIQWYFGVGDLTVDCVQNLILDLETRPRTEAFGSHGLCMTCVSFNEHIWVFPLPFELII